MYEFRTGAETAGGDRVVYDIANDEARYGAATVDGHALVWQLDDTDEDAEGALLSRRIQVGCAAERAQGSHWTLRPRVAARGRWC